MKRRPQGREYSVDNVWLHQLQNAAIRLKSRRDNFVRTFKYVTIETEEIVVKLLMDVRRRRLKRSTKTLVDLDLVLADIRRR